MMKKAAILTTAIALFAGGATAQTPEPPEEQEWLAQLVGEWDVQFEMMGQPAVPGTESVSALGQHWVVARTETTLMGTPFRGRLSLGYDAMKEGFHATWIDSMGGTLWTYEGTLDEERTTLTLDTEGPSMMDPTKTSRYREVIRITGEDSRTFSSSVENADGEWTTILTAEYERRDSSSTEAPAPGGRKAFGVRYLEIVTPEVESTCDALAKMHGISFSEAEARLGNARTAHLQGGGRIGVRAPMHGNDGPVVRPYLLVEDVDAALKAAEAAGAEIAMAATEIPGEGRFAIYFLGGIEHGLWER